MRGGTTSPPRRWRAANLVKELRKALRGSSRFSVTLNLDYRQRNPGRGEKNDARRGRAAAGAASYEKLVGPLLMIDSSQSPIVPELLTCPSETVRVI
eukprot:380799-Hanusia_phi.AAC.1